MTRSIAARMDSTDPNYLGHTASFNWVVLKVVRNSLTTPLVEMVYIPSLFESSWACA